MSTYHELAELLVAEAAELADELQGEPLPSRQRKILVAFRHLHRAAELVLELDPSPELSAEVLALQTLCLCGHDRGDHGAEAPHLCGGVPFVEGVRTSFVAVVTGDFGTCPCQGFEPERAHLDTVPDLMTDRAPALMFGIELDGGKS